MVANIKQFIPYRNEMITMFTAIAQYSPSEEYIVKTHRLFERMIPYMSRPENVMNWNEVDFDNFKFIIHELFLYFISLLLKHDRFKELDLFLKTRYYIKSNSGHSNNEDSSGYKIFRNYSHSLEHRNNRLKARRLSLHADLINERVTGTGLGFRQIMQADFVLYIRTELTNQDNHINWFPTTLLYAIQFHHAFEIVARASSKVYFEKMKCILDIEQLSELNVLVEATKNGQIQIPRWEHESIHLSGLLGFEQL